VRQALSHAESILEQRAATYADMQAELEQAQDLMVSRDQEIATLKTWVDQLEVKDAEIAKLRTRVSDLEPLRDRLFATEARLADEQQRFQKVVEEKDAQFVRLQSACDDMRAELLHREERVRTEKAQHQATVQEQEDQLQKLRAGLVEVESLRREIVMKQTALEQAEERRVMDVTERDEEIGALRRRLVEYRVAQRGLGNKAADRTQESPTREKTPSKPAHTAEQSKDDLKKIHGIGPVIERVLNRMGLVTFRQIAGWDRTDIERMADKLNTFPDRIVRDNWVEGAKKQHFLKYGEKL
jgi:predicted flap endonuclease-1-like 5' DNA nuclease